VRTIAIVVPEAMVLAAIYLLIALSWTVVYRATRVLNFATGNFLLLAALVYSTTANGLHWSPALALLAAVAVNVAVGALSYDLLMRPLAGRPVFSQIIVTFGLAVVMASVVSIIWGNQSSALASPVPKRLYLIPGGAVLTSLDLVIIIAALAFFGLVLLFLRFSRLGRQMRAAAESPLLASQTGIDINKVFRLAWMVAGIAMALGGIAAAYLTLVSNNLVELGLRGIAPALLGGLDDVRGVIVGAIVIALAEVLSAVYFGGGAQEVVPFLAILVVLSIRPYGLFGSAEVRRV
jgi:branched-chain amino acid transport system permease protein